MLSAQKQEMPSHTQPEGSRLPAATGFGKVLNSIQGLQQRLDDFSVEEVSRAHAQAHELIRGLGDLQAQLNALAKLKETIVSIHSQTVAIPEANFDLVAPDSLEKHPQLRAIVQAGKLIRMHRLLQAAQASAQSVSSDLEIAAAGSTSANSVEPRQVEDSPETPGTSTSDSATSSDKAAHAPKALTPTSGSMAQEPKPARTYEFSELKLEETHQPPSLPKEDSPQTATPGGKHGPTRKSKKAKGKSHFDRRLLNELIETYGEFAISTQPVGAAETSEVAPPDSTQTTQAETGPLPVQSTPIAVPAIQTKTRDLALKEPTALEPAFARPADSEMLALPSPAKKSAKPTFHEALTSAKSRGEIDRQLKNIIKDYGEYDLYSHRKSPSIRTVTIAAAAALALLLGAFYLFKSPSTPAPPAAIESTAPAAGIQDPSATNNAKQKN